jgi:AcrR family transcriptional regulator
MVDTTPDKPRARFIRLSGDDRRAALIEAALACIAEGGIAAFTVDRVCDKAGVSRGLITHHFGAMNILLAAAYSHIYAKAYPPRTDLTALIDHIFSPAQFNRDNLNIWLTLWAEISNNPDLGAEHRAQYVGYKAMVATALQQAAPTLQDAPTLAPSLICRVDGLGLQHCIDPQSMPPAVARQACLDLLAPYLDAQP